MANYTTACAVALVATLFALSFALRWGWSHDFDPGLGLYRYPLVGILALLAARLVLALVLDFRRTLALKRLRDAHTAAENAHLAGYLARREEAKMDPDFIAAGIASANDEPWNETPLAAHTVKHTICRPPSAFPAYRYLRRHMEKEKPAPEPSSQVSRSRRPRHACAVPELAATHDSAHDTSALETSSQETDSPDLALTPSVLADIAHTVGLSYDTAATLRPPTNNTFSTVPAPEEYLSKTHPLSGYGAKRRLEDISCNTADGTTSLWNKNYGVVEPLAKRRGKVVGMEMTGRGVEMKTEKRMRLARRKLRGFQAVMWWKGDVDMEGLVDDGRVKEVLQRGEVVTVGVESEAVLDGELRGKNLEMGEAERKDEKGDLGDVGRGSLVDVLASWGGGNGAVPTGLEVELLRRHPFEPPSALGMLSWAARCSTALDPTVTASHQPTSLSWSSWLASSAKLTSCNPANPAAPAPVVSQTIPVLPAPAVIQPAPAPTPATAEPSYEERMRLYDEEQAKMKADFAAKMQRK